MASFLVDSEDPKYGFLKDLGLTQKNLGVYNGKWMGSGEVCNMEIFNLSIVAKRIGNYSKSLWKTLKGQDVLRELFVYFLKNGKRSF